MQLYSEAIKETILKTTKAKSQGGNQYVGLCPVHGDTNPSLAIKFDGKKVLFHCHAGCHHEDIEDYFRKKRRRKSKVKKLTPEQVRKIKAILAKSVKIEKGSLADKYLASRGVGLLLNSKIAKFHPSLECWTGDEMLCLPAIVFIIRDSNNKIKGVQRIYLNDNGTKANIKTPKQAYGAVKQNAVKFGIVKDEVHLCEGPETAIAIYKALNRPVWCCIRAGNLSCQEIPKNISKVHIWADKDKSGTGQRESIKAAQIYHRKRHEVFIHNPPSELEEGAKSVDWLDEYNRDPDTLRQYYCDSVPFPWQKMTNLEVSAVLAVPFSSELLPKNIRTYCVDMSRLMQVPLEFLAIPLLVAAASVIGKQVVIRPKRNDYTLEFVPNLWGAIVANPGHLKTPSMKKALMPLHKLIDAEKKKIEQDKERYEFLEIELNGKLDKVKSDLKKGKIDSDSAYQTQQQIKEELEEKRPIERRYLSNDSTIEKLADILKDNPNGLLVFRDELIGLFQSMEKPGKEEDKSFYLEAWSGDQSKQIDRIMRGSSFVPSLYLSLLGGIVPNKLDQYLYQKIHQSGDDGFIDRFQLLVYPEFPKNWKYVDKMPKQSLKNEIIEVFERLDQIRENAGHYGLKQDTHSDNFYLQFSDEAQKMYEQWATKLELRIRSGKLSPEISGHIGKYRSLMPKLALVLHLIDQVDKDRPRGEIGLISIKRSIILCNILEMHLEKIYHKTVNRKEYSAHELLGKIKQGKVQDGQSIKSIYHNNWSMLKNRDQVVSAIEVLETHNMVKINTVLNENGGRPSDTIKIHPDLLKSRTVETAKTPQKL